LGGYVSCPTKSINAQAAENITVDCLKKIFVIITRKTIIKTNRKSKLFYLLLGIPFIPRKNGVFLRR